MTMYQSMRDELHKIAGDDGVSRSEAVGALKRLQKLERRKLKGEELARGALTGAVVGPTAALAAKTVSGDVGKAIKGALAPDKVKGVLRAKTRLGKAKALGLAAYSGLRGLGGAAASGAVFGSALPVVRRHLDESAEKEKLQQYLGTSKGGKVHRQIKRRLGI
jgi:hypothetical protein